MRIVIVGAGKLGYSIADYLTREDHDVIVVESNEEHREIIKNNLDVLTIQGNGASPAVLSDPNVKSADILIACTYNDEVNMMICMMAKKIGIKKTIARIRSNEYTGIADNFIRDVTDIDLVLNPEKIISLEIKRLLLSSFALDMSDFADGKVKILETKITEEYEHINKTLSEINFPNGILIVGILRNNKLIIPNGNDVITLNDIVFFIGLTDSINNFEKTMEKKKETIERVLIIGAGRISQYLVPMLEEQNISLKIIEKNIARCDKLSNILKEGIVIHGDGTDIELLREEGVAEADIVICLTEDDKLNLLLALLAKHLGTKKTIVKIAFTEYADLMEKVGVDIVVSTRIISVSEVLRFVRSSGVIGVSLFEDAKAEALEVIIKDDSPIAGIPLRNANFTNKCLVGAIVHKGKAIIPNGNTVLYPGDRAIFFADFDAVNELMSYIEGR